MKEYMSKMGNDGRIVIPAEFRRQLQLVAGENVVLRIEDNELHVYPAKHALTKARQAVQRYAKGKSLVKELKAMRQDDNKSE